MRCTNWGGVLKQAGADHAAQRSACQLNVQMRQWTAAGTCCHDAQRGRYRNNSRCDTANGDLHVLHEKLLLTPAQCSYSDIANARVVWHKKLSRDRNLGATTHIATCGHSGSDCSRLSLACQ